MGVTLRHVSVPRHLRKSRRAPLSPQSLGAGHLTQAEMLAFAKQAQEEEAKRLDARNVANSGLRRPQLEGVAQSRPRRRPVHLAYL